MTESRDPAEFIFQAALERPTPLERAAFVEGACGKDPALLARVKELLGSHEQSRGPLDAPPANLGVTAAYWIMREGPGTRIGPYKLLQQIGEGGMGVVYMAEQEQPIRRKVALKIIKPGMDSSQVLARFEAERQALALMDHQNIARVLDASTTDSGRPYFVMELIHGVPITRYCDDNHLMPRQRLELFVPVCQAIQHAHQKGIIHRDIKPSNVLVTMYDDKPVPKVIDFGVAKAVEQRLTERTMFTQFGALVGTFEYMSPEQAEMNAFGVDTRSDVYSLGVLLYELMTGSTPLDKKRVNEVALDELVRLIREEEPPRPSLRLSSSDTLAKIAANRHMEPAALSKLVRGEIDWIAMKCLEKDRTRRYETANALARDVERYLHDEPVEACPPSAGYRLRKFSRKHRTALVAVTAIAILLLGGIAASTWLALRARMAERQAVDAQQEAQSERDRAMRAQAEAEDARRSESQQKDIAMEMAKQQVKATQSAAEALKETKKLLTEVERQRAEAETQRAAAQASKDELRQTLYAAHMNLAQTAWEQNKVGRVLELLESEKESSPELCGLEWHYLNRLCHGNLSSVECPNMTEFATMNSLGTHLATFLHEDGEVGGQRLVVYEVATSAPKLNVKLDDAIEWDWRPALAPDGSRVAYSGCKDFRTEGNGVLGIWDVATSKSLFAVSGLAWLPTATVFSPDGSRVAAAIVTGEKNWKRRSGFLTEPRNHKRKGEIKIWNVATGAVALTIADYWRSSLIPQLAFSADGTRLASCVFSEHGKEGEHQLKIWDSTTGKLLQAMPTTIAGHGGALAFHPGGQFLAIAGEAANGDGRVQAWDVASGKLVFDITTEEPLMGDLGYWVDPTIQLAYSPDGARLACADEARRINLWDARTGQKVRTMRGHASTITAIAFSADSSRLISVSYGDGELKVWDATPPKETVRLDVLCGPNPCVALSAEAKRVAVLALDGTVKVWDEAGKPLLTLKGTSQEMEPDVLTQSLTFSDDGRHLILASKGSDEMGGFGDLVVWDEKGKEIFALRDRSGDRPGALLGAYSGILSPDNSLLAAFVEVSGSKGDGLIRHVRLWEVAGGKLLRTLPGDGAEFGGTLAFAPDGKSLYVGCAFGEDGEVEHEIRRYEVAGGRELRRIKVGATLLSYMVFSPDGKWIAAARTEEGEPAEIVVWNVETGEEIMTLWGTGNPADLGFTPDGKRLIAGGSHSRKSMELYFWDVESGTQVFTLKEHAGRLGTFIIHEDSAHITVAAVLPTGKGIELKTWDGTPVKAGDAEK